MLGLITVACILLENFVQDGSISRLFAYRPKKCAKMPYYNMREGRHTKERSIARMEPSHIRVF